MDAAAHYDTMVHHLRVYYPQPYYTAAGVMHPLMWYAAPPEQQDDIDSVLGRWVDERPQSFPVYDYGYLGTMRNSGRTVYDGTTFIFKNLKRKPLKIDASLGGYFDMLATCAALERELRDAASEIYIRLPFRSLYHRNINPVVSLKSGKGRSAAIGGACLTVCNRDGEYVALLGRRSGNAATDPGFYHLLPAFIFQPMGSTVQEGEWSIRHHIEREFLEELFAMPEERHPERIDYFQSHPALVNLHAMMEQGDASLSLTGVSINLLTLRPEISALLLIHDPTWYESVTSPNSATPLNVLEEAHGAEFIPIATDEGILAVLPPNVHTRMPPQATAALWEGVRMAREKIAQYATR
jgi:hypothetical protein